MTKINADVQGQNANKNGKWLEDQVEKELLKYGIKSILYRKLKTAKGKEFISKCSKGFLLKNVPYTNMFGSKAWGEFVLVLFNVGVFRIECRGQAVAGSVQDKLPKLLEDCKCMDESNVIVVLDGEGMSYNAKTWFRKAAAAVHFKDIKVQSLIQFKLWLKDTLSVKIKPVLSTTLNSLVKNSIKIDSKNALKNSLTNQ